MRATKKLMSAVNCVEKRMMAMAYRLVAGPVHPKGPFKQREFESDMSTIADQYAEVIRAVLPRDFESWEDPNRFLREHEGAAQGERMGKPLFWRSCVVEGYEHFRHSMNTLSDEWQDWESEEVHYERDATGRETHEWVAKDLVVTAWWLCRALRGMEENNIGKDYFRISSQKWDETHKFPPDSEGVDGNRKWLESALAAWGPVVGSGRTTHPFVDSYGNHYDSCELAIKFAMGEMDRHQEPVCDVYLVTTSGKPGVCVWRASNHYDANDYRHTSEEH